MRRHRWVALLVLFVVIAAACGSGDGDGAPAAGDGQPAGSAGGTGDLPTAEFEMADGTTATFADFLVGKPLVINYFASWCPPCRAEMPGFQAVFADVGDQVTFLGMDLQDTKADGAALVEETGVQYPWGLDPDGRIYAALRGFAMPTTVYVAADGTIVDKENGSITEATLRQRMQELFGVQA